MANHTQTSQQVKFRELIYKHFDLNGVKDIFFDLGVNHEDVPQSYGLKGYVTHLLKHMAYESRENELIALLRKKRPHISWPDTYQLTTSSPDLNSSIYIAEQNINITHNNITQQAKPTRKSRKKTATRKEINTKDLYELVFYRTPMYVNFYFVISIVFLILTLIVVIVTWNIYNAIAPLLVFAVIVAFTFYPLRVLIYRKIDKQTDFYDEKFRVPDRKKVKENLQQRDWGHEFYNQTCPRLIEWLLIPNKDEANKKLKF